MKEKVKKETGITLIALIITIIVMLILSAVAISMITDKESIFANAEDAGEKYNTASKNESDTLKELLKQYIEGGNGSTGENEPTVKPVPNLTEGNTTFTYTPTLDKWAKSVNVGISTTVEGYTLQYSLDNGSTWNNYEQEIPVTINNQEILARLADGSRAGEATKGKVTNVDTENPTTATIVADEATVTTRQATLIATGIDIEETENSGKSGIQKYVFYVDGAEYETVETTEETASITLTFTANSHSCYVIVYDHAGNTLTSEAFDANKHIHNSACYGNTLCGRTTTTKYTTTEIRCKKCGSYVTDNGSPNGVGYKYCSVHGNLCNSCGSGTCKVVTGSTLTCPL